MVARISFVFNGQLTRPTSNNIKARIKNMVEWYTDSRISYNRGHYVKANYSTYWLLTIDSDEEDRISLLVEALQIEFLDNRVKLITVCI